MIQRPLVYLCAALIACPAHTPPLAVGTASLVSGSFSTFLVEADCAADDTPAECDPPVGYPVELGVPTALVATFTPSDAMCGDFQLTLRLDQEVAWEGTVPGGGHGSQTFIIGEADPGLHVLSLDAKATDKCYGGKLNGWYGTFTLSATEPSRLGSASVRPTTGAAAPPSTASTVSSEDLGREVFVVCEPCHGANGAGRQALNAPGIAAQEPWYLRRQLQNFMAGIRGTHDQDLYGMQMRPMALELSGEGKLDAVVNHVASLPHPKPPRTLQGDPGRGAELFLVCAVCHGEDAGGDQELGAPRLTVQQDWYLVRQIGNFREGLRGFHADDRFGRQMRPMTGTLPDQEAVLDVVAFIQTIRDGGGPTASEIVAAAPPRVAPPAPAVAVAPAPAPAATAPAATAPAAPAPAAPKPAPASAPKPAPAVAATAAPPAPAAPDKATLVARGAEVYAKICAPCHQATGQGVPGAFPPIAGAGAFYGSPQKHAGIIINGLSGPITVKGAAYNGVMPPQGSLSDLDIAAVATYERNSWGNADGIVTPADVKAAR